MTTLFVSDVHLSAARPARVDAFLRFLETTASKAPALYVLGDLFDEWLGDDDDRPPHPRVMAALRRLVDDGVEVFALHGNHDFLLGVDFERATGCRLMADPSVTEIDGRRTMLMHGDTLCTRDVDYQAFRKTCRDPGNQRDFLSLPLDARIARAASLRLSTSKLSRLKPDDIMDVDPDEVAAVMAAHDAPVLIHGHTHRPAIHSVDVEGRAGTRIVLGDWYERDSVLRVIDGKFDLEA